MPQLRTPLARCFGLGGIAAALLTAASVWAQRPVLESNPNQPPPAIVDDLYTPESRFRDRPRNPSSHNPVGFNYTRTRQRARVVMEVEQQELSAEERKLHENVEKLRKQIHVEKDEEARAKLGESLRDQLSKIFDDDLSDRDEQLKQLEDRVGKLRDAIEKRRKNRDRIITLQVDSVMLDAEGLSFPSIQSGPYIPSTRSSRVQNVSPWRPAYSEQRRGPHAVRPVESRAPQISPERASVRPAL